MFLFRRFEIKLDVLKKFFKVQEIPLTNMLAFVIMVEQFNKESNYINMIVTEALKDIELFGKQKTLLVIIKLIEQYSFV